MALPLIKPKESEESHLALLSKIHVSKNWKLPPRLPHRAAQRRKEFIDFTKITKLKKMMRSYRRKNGRIETPKGPTENAKQQVASAGGNHRVTE
ncbi:CBM_collapsed_G0029320.mRNA.1.CDS.1 [Saccharomyces cerevisiae]|nr:CBM_collapsed_G0029320.mRNA.1.CDS.1 [Saccharomyces cerevisiae]